MMIELLQDLLESEWRKLLLVGIVKYRVLQSISQRPQCFQPIVESLSVVQHQPPDVYVRCCEAIWHRWLA